MSDSGTSIAVIGLSLAALAMSATGSAVAQPPEPRARDVVPGGNVPGDKVLGDVVTRDVIPRDVRKMYERGLHFLAARLRTKNGPPCDRSRLDHCWPGRVSSGGAAVILTEER